MADEEVETLWEELPVEVWTVVDVEAEEVELVFVCAGTPTGREGICGAEARRRRVDGGSDSTLGPMGEVTSGSLTAVDVLSRRLGAAEV